MDDVEINIQRKLNEAYTNNIIIRLKIYDHTNNIKKRKNKFNFLNTKTFKQKLSKYVIDFEHFRNHYDNNRY
mgnify:FL=1